MTAVLLALSSLTPAAPLPRKPPVPPSYSALAGAEWRVDWNGRPYILTLLRCRTYFFEWDPPKSPLWAGVWYVEAGQLRLREWAREGGDAVVEYRFRGTLPRLEARPGPRDPTPSPVTLVIRGRRHPSPGGRQVDRREGGVDGHGDEVRARAGGGQ
jgi:hypothetical protein